MKNSFNAAAILELLKAESEFISTANPDMDRLRAVAAFVRVCLDALEIAAIERRLEQLEL